MAELSTEPMMARFKEEIISLPPECRKYMMAATKRQVTAHLIAEKIV